MFDDADKADFERMLDDILERAITAAATAGLEVEAQFVKAGGVSNSRLPIATEQKIFAPMQGKRSGCLEGLSR